MSDQWLSRRDFLRLTGVCAASVVSAGIPLAAVASPAHPPPPHPLARGYQPDVLLGWVSAIYDLVRQERFSPPSAARAYGYVAVAAYESVVPGMPDRKSLAGQLNGLGPAPVPARAERIHWPLALNAAVEQAAVEVFADRSGAARNSLRDHASAVRQGLAAGVDPEIGAQSDAHGRRVGDHVAAWIGRDGYAEILGLPYNPPAGSGLWERTPPNFGFAIEPYWERVRPLALQAVDSCAPAPPVPFSSAPGSAFWEQAMVVYRTSSGLGDTERATALYWRDNPDGSSGLPSGHWMLIAASLVRDRGSNLASAAEVLALTGISLADAFTSCWTEKYRRNLLRPVTFIRSHIDSQWSSFVNSPAFPEYTSGHSVGSGAAAATLTSLLGSTGFTDATGVPYGRESRAYASAWEAAEEAATSRLYGGIHYPMAISVGLDQGVHVASEVLKRVETSPGRTREAKRGA